MDKKTDSTIVLISKGSLFLVNNIRNNLTKSGYKVIVSTPVVESLQSLRKEADIFIFYLLFGYKLSILNIEIFVYLFASCLNSICCSKCAHEHRNRDDGKKTGDGIK